MKILYMNTEILAEQKVFEKGMKLLSEKRKNKLQQFKSPMPARLSLGAGILLRIALEECGLGNQINQIAIGSYGKPYLQHTDFHFSLSHSGKYAVCAFSSAPIGADLQQIKEKLPCHTTKILSDAEKIYLNTFTKAKQIQLFYRLWARKESLAKWDGRGLRLSMEQLSFVWDGILLDKTFFEGKQLYFQEYQDLLPEYALCICCETDHFSEKIEEITAESLKNL